MNIYEIAEAIIYKQHGWAVAEQFEVTWDNRSVDSVAEQNMNAMDYIKSTIESLTYSDAFNEDAIDELNQYLLDINAALEYIAMHDDGPEYDSAGFTEDDRIVNGQYRVISNEAADEDYKASLVQDEQRYEDNKK